MPLFILSLLFQVALVVHILKTGRNTTWIWIVVMLPGAGSIAYLLIEVLPDLLGSRTGRRVTRNVQQLVNPHKHFRSAAREYAVADTVQNSLRLAEECEKTGMLDDARTLYEKALTGIHESSPEIMFGLARCEFMLERFARSKQVLDELILKNPGYRNQEAHLLFARSLEKLGDYDSAREEYETLAGYYSGAEARYRFAAMLHELGDRSRARQLWTEIVNTAQSAGRHFRTINREWIALSRKALAQ